MADAAADPRRQELFGLLGDLPAVHGPVGCTRLGTEDRGSFVLEHLVLDLNGIERAPAYFTRPKGATGPMPAVLFHHSHASAAKDELLHADGYMPPTGWAEALAREGIAALCFDAWNFGERRQPGPGLCVAAERAVWRGPCRLAY